jgi:hypothetical protein
VDGYVGIDGGEGWLRRRRLHLHIGIPFLVSVIIVDTFEKYWVFINEGGWMGMGGNGIC